MSIIRKITDRTKPGENIGLGNDGGKGNQRTINADGSYNMERRTGRLLGNFYLYHWLITTTWTKYWLSVLVYYLVMNLIFAMVYFTVGVQTLGGTHDGSTLGKFLHCFFFSAQSFTTVGYGGIYPIGRLTNFIAVLEAFTGLMTFAIATGTLYGRFSKAVSRIIYSRNIIIAPFKNITGMQFMVADGFSSSLMEMEARVNISWVEDEGNGTSVRRFQQVNLEIDKIAMFPTSWTLNHPIDEESALYGKTAEDIKKMDVEVFVLMKGFDDTFSQTVYSRQSFKADQFVFGAKFRRPFSINDEGQVIMDLTTVGEYDLVTMPQAKTSAI